MNICTKEEMQKMIENGEVEIGDIECSSITKDIVKLVDDSSLIVIVKNKIGNIHWDIAFYPENIKVDNYDNLSILAYVGAPDPGDDDEFDPLIAKIMQDIDIKEEIIKHLAEEKPGRIQNFIDNNMQIKSFETYAPCIEGVPLLISKNLPFNENGTLKINIQIQYGCIVTQYDNSNIFIEHDNKGNLHVDWNKNHEFVDFCSRHNLGTFNGYNFKEYSFVLNLIKDKVAEKLTKIA